MSEPPDAIARLQAIIDHSVATAGTALRRYFVRDGWVMSAEEFIDFWAAEPMASVSTTSAKGNVHVALLQLTLSDGRFHIVTPIDSQRLLDHRANPRCAISSWDGPHRAVIVYGNAAIATDPDDQTRDVEQDLATWPGSMVNVIIEPTRIYPIRPPEGYVPPGDR